MNRGVGLGGEHDGCPGFTNDASRPMIRECGFRAGNDFLSFISEQNDQIILFPFLGRFVEPAQRVEVIGQFQDGIDIKTLALEFLRHRETDNLPLVDLGNGKRRFIRTKDLGDFRIEKEFQIRAQGPLHTAKLLFRLVEVAAKCRDKLVGPLIATIHQCFNRSVGVPALSKSDEYLGW